MNLKYSLFVLLGASSYGILASIAKLAFNAGFSVKDVTGSQYLFGLILLLVILPFFPKIKISLKSAGLLMLAGTFLSLTGIFYGISIDQNSASLAVVLLFQFTWIGILIESIYERTLPTKKKAITIPFLLIGTVFASNLLNQQLITINLEGLLYGFLSAITFALFMFISGKVALEVPGIQRSFYITLGGVLLVLIVFSPSFFVDGQLFNGLWKFAILTAIFGVIFPIVLFAISAPKLDTGLMTILGAAELPAAIIAAVIILDENIIPTQLFGIFLILIGITIPQIQRGQTPTTLMR